MSTIDQSSTESAANVHHSFEGTSLERLQSALSTLLSESSEVSDLIRAIAMETSNDLDTERLSKALTTHSITDIVVQLAVLSRHLCEDLKIYPLQDTQGKDPFLSLVIYSGPDCHPQDDRITLTINPQLFEAIHQLRSL